MLSDQEIEAAHPEAFDFVFGNLTEAGSVWFNRHLEGCSHCQRVVTEYSEIGQIIQSLPPHAEAPAGLEDRTVAAMISALPAGRTKADRRSEEDEDQAATRVYRLPRFIIRLSPRPRSAQGFSSRPRPSPTLSSTHAPPASQRRHRPRPSPKPGGAAV